MVQTIQATFLVDTAQSTVIDIHCSTKWLSSITIGPQVALRNAGNLRSLAADKGYDDMGFRDELRVKASDRLSNTVSSYHTITPTTHGSKTVSTISVRSVRL